LRKSGILSGLVLAEFEIDVFGITASITLKRSQIVPLRCGFNLNQVGVLQDLADGRIRIAEASRLMGLGRRQVFRLAKAYGKHGPEALVSRRRGRPSNRCYPTAYSVPAGCQSFASSSANSFKI
jgi:hypothetical protein